MSPRFLVNPGTPQAWEIQLKPGVNRIGRGEHNDFQVPHTSISGSHCEVVVGDDGSVILKDLGSTNGSFVNRAPVREAALQSGQHLQLGAVDMIFESANAPAAAAAAPVAAPRMTVRLGAAPTAAPAAPPLPPPVTARPPGLRLSGAAAAPAPAAAAVVAEESSEAAPPPEEPLAAGAQFCKFHAKIPARFYCGKCRKFFCDLCVGTRASPAGSVRTCRACASTVTPVQVHIQRAGDGEKGFFRQLPGAFIYPFKGAGVLVLIFATLLFSAMAVISGGFFNILIQIVILGYVFIFMQNIVHSTAAGENELPGIPEMDGLFSGFLNLAATVILSFGVPIGLGVWAIIGEQMGLGPYIIGTAILGCLYFPMAFLAVAMKDSPLAANPLVVIPAILKVPGEYLVAALLMGGVLGMRELGDLVMSGMKMVGYSTRDMSVLFMTFGLRAAWSFTSVYLLTVAMRVLGLLYVTKKQRFGWYSH